VQPGHWKQGVPHRRVWHAQAEGAGMMFVPQRPWPRSAWPCHTRIARARFHTCSASRRDSMNLAQRETLGPCATFRTCLASRRDRMNVAQRETLGSRGRHVSLSPGGTAEGSVVPAGLRMVSASPTPALRAGLRSGRPCGTTGTLNKSVNPDVHRDSHQQPLTEGSLRRCFAKVLSGSKAGTRVYVEAI